MATSSITANIELKDPKAVRAFVDALCSDEHWPQPEVKVSACHLDDPREIREFFATKRNLQFSGGR